MQNPTLYQQYVIAKMHMAKRLGRTDRIETAPLWHGTNEESVSKITSGRFDRALSGKNGR